MLEGGRVQGALVEIQVPGDSDSDIHIRGEKWVLFGKAWKREVRSSGRKERANE